MLYTSFKFIGLSDLEKKIFLRFLPYMSMAASLVMWPGPFEQIFVPLSYGGSIWNLGLIGPVDSEEKMF